MDEDRDIGLDKILMVLEFLVDTARKRHIVGGVLLSFSALFAGLAITSMTVKEEEDE